jgi:hypothetical protein
VSIVLLALALLMILPAAAPAASGADPSNPSLDQYVESVPSADGNRNPPSSGGSDRSADALPPEVRQRIGAQGGPDAKQLEAITSSPAYGAPEPKKHPGGDAKPSRASDGPAPSGLDAVTTAATGSGDGSSIGLLLGGLVLITVVAGGVAIMRRRSPVS